MSAAWPFRVLLLYSSPCVGAAAGVFELSSVWILFMSAAHGLTVRTMRTMNGGYDTRTVRTMLWWPGIVPIVRSCLQLPLRRHEVTVIKCHRYRQQTWYHWKGLDTSFPLTPCLLNLTMF